MDAQNEIKNYIQSFGDWRADRLQELRGIVNSTGLKEDYKWNVPVWSGKKLVCAISGHKNYVKINFFKGVYLPDQSLFNSGLDSKEHRSININKDDTMNKTALQKLLEAAINHDKGSV